MAVSPLCLPSQQMIAKSLSGFDPTTGSRTEAVSCRGFPVSPICRDKPPSRPCIQTRMSPATDHAAHGCWLRSIRPLRYRIERNCFKLGEFYVMNLSNLSCRMREKGLWKCLRWLVLQIYDRSQEWRLGITTSTFIHWRELGLDENSESYEAIDYGTFGCVIRRIRIQPNDVFLDYGCGMGRVIILAARQPFRRVIGVELAPRLCALAEKNLQLARRRLTCNEVQIVNSDASDFIVPNEVSVVWLFSPFFGEVMKNVTARIRESLETAPRPITIIHVIPDNVASAFRECGWLSKTAEFRVGGWKQLTCLIFQNIE